VESSASREINELERRAYLGISANSCESCIMRFAIASCLVCAAAASSVGGTVVQDPLAVWKNHSEPTENRITDLISRLSLEEKAALLQASSPAIPRIGLPAYEWARECERGDVSGPNGTAYPTPLALAASFDVDLVHEVALATALEVRGNVNMAASSSHEKFSASCYGPVSNLVRDSRWGRSAEMITGEDPRLGRILSRSFTWGMQTPPLREQGDSGYRMLVTIAKHLNTYAGPEGWGFTFGYCIEPEYVAAMCVRDPVLFH